MKKVLPLLLCFVLLLSLLTGCAPSFPSAGSGESTPAEENTENNLPVQVAEAPDLSDVDHTGPCFLDLAYYSAGQFDMSRITDMGFCDRVRVFDAPYDCRSVLAAYVDVLCRKFAFEPVCEPYYDDNGRNGDGERIRFSYVLRYTGAAHTSDTPITCEYTAQQGDLILSGNSRGDQWEVSFRLFSAKWLMPVDDGTRYHPQDPVFYGASFSTALNLLPDGSYATADGRLTAAPGQAMFLTSGKTALYSAHMEWSDKRNQKRICVQDSFGVDQMAFALPLAQPVTSGAAYNASVMDSNTAGSSQTIPTNNEPMFALLHNGRYIAARGGLSDGMTRFNARMMYWDETRQAAVLYFYAAFSGAPYEVEGLVAVDLANSGAGITPGNADYTLQVGQSLSITGPSEFKTGHELWKWSCTGGAEYAELQDTVSQTCTLIAKKPGTVRLQVVYDYSVKEPDILTGIETTVQKEETEEYTVLITG